MNVKTLSIVAALFATFGSTAVLADEYTANHNMPTAAVSSAPRLAERVANVDEYQRNQNVPVVASSGLHRAQVRAEAMEARKLGVVSDGELSAPTPTVAQAEQIRLAGLRAIEQRFAAK